MTTYNTIQRALRDLLVALDVDPDDISALNDASAPESVEPDPWPTARTVAASVDGGAPQLLVIQDDDTAMTMTGALCKRDRNTLTNVVPVTVVPTAEWEALRASVKPLGYSGHTLGSAGSLIYATTRLLSATDALGLD